MIYYLTGNKRNGKREKKTKWTGVWWGQNQFVASVWIFPDLYNTLELTAQDDDGNAFPVLHYENKHIKPAADALENYYIVHCNIYPESSEKASEFCEYTETFNDEKSAHEFFINAIKHGNYKNIHTFLVSDCEANESEIFENLLFD